MRETFKYDGLGRIGIDPERVKLIDFETYVRLACMPARMVQVMKKYGRRTGADPGNWLASLSPVFVADWERAEIFTGSRWIPNVASILGMTPMGGTKGLPAMGQRARLLSCS
jgi:hypothetical protein